MFLNELGEIAQNQWVARPEHYPGIRMDEYMIMPNHIHGIFWIEEKVESPEEKPHSLSEIIRGFKTWSSKQIIEARRMTGTPVWQRSFYDQVIQNERHLNAIREYIQNNPLNWALDKEFKEE